jgi:proline iminopeptidase
MKRGVKMIIILVTIVVLMGAVAGFLFFSMGPLYTPGQFSGEWVKKISLSPTPDQSTDTDFWKVEEDVELYHFYEGEGRNVLFVHGYEISPVNTPVDALETLTDSFRFHYYHRRGCGKSTRPIDTFPQDNYYENMIMLDNKLGIAQQIADIERIRKILGDEKLILMGHSYGGFISSLYALEFPERVEKLILIAPANLFKLPQEEGGLYTVVGEYLSEERKIEYDAWLKTYFDYGNIFKRSEEELVAINWAFVSFYKEAALNYGMPISSEIGEKEMAGGWVSHAENFSLGNNYDIRSALAGIKASTLLIHGEKDINGPGASGEYIDNISNIKVEIIKGAGHFAHVDSPEIFARLVGDFLQNN